MHNRLLTFALPALLLGLAAHVPAMAAPTHSLSATFSACTDRARGLAAQKTCIAQETARQDARLNAAYAALGRKLTPAARSRLQVAQRAWLQTRARDGEFVTSLLGAPPSVNLEGAVMDAQALASRADLLEHYLDQLR